MKTALFVLVAIISIALPAEALDLKAITSKPTADNPQFDNKEAWPDLVAEGRGRFVGVNLHVWNPNPFGKVVKVLNIDAQRFSPRIHGTMLAAARGWWWGEGDEKFFVDGEKMPSTFGTGSEDYFAHAWMQAPAGLLRKDMSPKPAYNVLKTLIKEQWWTETSLTTDASGTATFRGFYGEYELTVTTPDGGQRRIKNLKIRKSPQQMTTSWTVDGSRERRTW